MDNDGRTASPVWAGLPQTEHSALTPVGEIEQAAKIAAGLRQPRHGWRKAVVIMGFVVVALGVVAVVIAGFLEAAQQ